MALAEIRAALATKLLATPAVMALLPLGTNGIVNERRVTRTKHMPVIALHGGVGGPWGNNDAFELWDVRVYNSTSDYIAIEAVMEEVRTALDRQPLPLASGASVAVVQVQWLTHGQSGFDPVLQLNYEFHRFRIWYTRF